VAGYKVYDGGLVQVVRRISRPDVISWTEATRRAMNGQWQRWSPAGSTTGASPSAGPDEMPACRPSWRFWASGGAGVAEPLDPGLYGGEAFAGRGMQELRLLVEVGGRFDPEVAVGHRPVTSSRAASSSSNVSEASGPSTPHSLGSKVNAPKPSPGPRRRPRRAPKCGPGYGQLHEVARAHLIGPTHDGPVEAAHDGKAPLDHMLGRQGTGMAAQRFRPAPAGLELCGHRPAPVAVVQAPPGQLQVGARVCPLQAVGGVA